MIVTIQTIQINNYRLSIFPEDRIKTLISELNVHYEKINNYIKYKIQHDKIDIEFIDCLAKLHEILRLALNSINTDIHSGDYKQAIGLLESVITLLQCGYGSSIRNEFYDFWSKLLKQLYNYSFEYISTEA